MVFNLFAVDNYTHILIQIGCEHNSVDLWLFIGCSKVEFAKLMTTGIDVFSEIEIPGDERAIQSQGKLTEEMILKNKQKLTGAHDTPRILAEFVARQIIQVIQAFILNTKSKKIRVLDPGVGDGELLLSLIGELLDKGYDNLDVHGFDTDRPALNLASSRIIENFPNIPITLPMVRTFFFWFLNFAFAIGL